MVFANKDGERLPIHRILNVRIVRHDRSYLHNGIRGSALVRHLLGICDIQIAKNFTTNTTPEIFRDAVSKDLSCIQSFVPLIIYLNFSDEGRVKLSLFTELGCLHSAVPFVYFRGMVSDNGLLPE